jgi:hypothetical protein
MEFHGVIRKAHPMFVATKASVATMNTTNKTLSTMSGLVIIPRPALCRTEISSIVTPSEPETNRYEFRNNLDAEIGLVLGK